MVEAVVFEQGVEQESGVRPEVAPALGPVPGVVEPNWPKVLQVEAKRLAPTMMSQKS